MKDTLINLFEKRELMPVFERIARFHPEFGEQAKRLYCLHWSYIGNWSQLSRTFEVITHKQKVYRVGIAQGKIHIYSQGEYGSWEYVTLCNRCRLKFVQVLGEILIKAEEDAKGGRYQWLA